MGFNCLKARATLMRQFTFYHKFPKILILILLTCEGWKAESTLEPPSGFELGTPGLGIQHLNRWAIALWGSHEYLISEAVLSSETQYCFWGSKIAQKEFMILTNDVRFIIINAITSKLSNAWWKNIWKILKRRWSPT